MMPCYSSIYSVNRQVFLAKQNYKKFYNKKQSKTEKQEVPSFFEAMRPNTKLAFVFFVLAKICCFTIAPGIVILARAGSVPKELDFLGIVIYGLFVLLAIIFALRDVFNKTSIPSRQEVEKWKSYYNMDN